MPTSEQRRVLLEAAQLFTGTDRRRAVLNELAGLASAAPSEGRKQAADTIRQWIRDHESELNYREFTRIDAALDRFIDRLATAPAMSEAAHPEPDMVWPKHDTERFYHSLDAAVDDEFCLDGLVPDQVLTFECATRLPDVRVKIIAVENTEERQSIEWEVERIDRAAAKGESDVDA